MLSIYVIASSSTRHQMCCLALLHISSWSPHSDTDLAFVFSASELPLFFFPIFCLYFLSCWPLSMFFCFFSASLPFSSVCTLSPPSPQLSLSLFSPALPSADDALIILHREVLSLRSAPHLSTDLLLSSFCSPSPS